jgi:hypothetical protein
MTKPAIPQNVQTLVETIVAEFNRAHFRKPERGAGSRPGCLSRSARYAPDQDPGRDISTIAQKLTEGESYAPQTRIPWNLRLLR